MALCSYDEAYTIPTEHAAKLSLRTMQLLIHEVGLSDTVDPLAGSYFVETMTNEMETEMVRLISKLDEEGGIVAAVADGRVQAEVNRQAYDRERRVANAEVKKVGVNIYREEEEDRAVEMHPYRQEEAERQLARLRTVRHERDSGAVSAALDELREAAREGRNVMPAAIDAVEAYATVGEVCGALQDVYGSYREPIRF
jgi:methylmalonyl-CoA mutase N-terminal domain/subunit